LSIWESRNKEIINQMETQLKHKLQEKLEEIADIASKSICIYDAPGVLSGVSGIALFMFYYSRFAGIEKYADYGRQALKKAIDLIDGGFISHTYCIGISGLTWTCEHLARHGFIRQKEASFVNTLNPYLLSMMEKDFNDGNYDFLHGGLGVGYYFMTKNKINGKAINCLLDGLERTAEKTFNGCMKWKSVMNIDSIQTGYNISLSHGMSSIVACMAKLYKLHPEFSRAKNILSDTVKYIIQQRLKKVEISHFPTYSLESETKTINHSRLGWCYGDLGIAQALLQAANVLEDKELEDMSVDILLYTCNRKDMSANYVVDAGLCHGTAGIAHSFQRIYKELSNPVFQETAYYWLDKTLKMAVFENGLAGFKTWSGDEKQWTNNYSFLDGIPGIGCCLISALNNGLTDWDECLLLS
jgi:lantibiotic modifying enzyme